MWLLEESYSQVGDFSETVSLIVPQKITSAEISLAEMMDKFVALKDANEERKSNSSRSHGFSLVSRKNLSSTN